jgi:hypothetical protein
MLLAQKAVFIRNLLDTHFVSQDVERSHRLFAPRAGAHSVGANVQSKCQSCSSSSNLIVWSCWRFNFDDTADLIRLEALQSVAN